MFCRICGRALPDGATYCGACGTETFSAISDDAGKETAGKTIGDLPEETVAYSSLLSEAYHTPYGVPSDNAPKQRGVHCPKCGGHNLSTVVENEMKVSGGGYSFSKGCCGSMLLGPFGFLCGAGGKKIKASTESRYFWVCNSCGHKFRNAEDELREMQAGVRTAIGGAVGLFFFSCICLGIDFRIFGESVGFWGMLSSLILGALSIYGLPADSLFCVNCGEPVAEIDSDILQYVTPTQDLSNTVKSDTTCSACQAMLTVSASFCNECGSPTEETSPSEA